MPLFDFLSARGRYVALGWAYMGSWGGLSDPPISATRTALQALGQPPPEKPIYALSIAW